MAQFRFEDTQDFDHRQALIALLRLLDELFAEVFEDRRWLFDRSFQGDITPALAGARDQIGALVEAVTTHQRSGRELDDYGLRGEPLRFKLQVVRYANDRAAPLRNFVIERISDGRAGGARSLYRRTLEGTLAAIDGPLESVTKLLGIGEGVVEFKKALEVLLRL